MWCWGGVDRGDVSLNVQLPGLPGPAWIHFAANWDGDEGIFDAFLNGTPLRAPGTRLVPWSPGEGDEAILHLGRFAMTAPRFSPTHLSREDLRSKVTLLCEGKLDGILGARSRGTLLADEAAGELLHENSLVGEDSAAGWRLEGPGRIKF